MTSLCDVWWWHDCMPSTFPKVKKNYSWGTSFVSKEEVVYLFQHFYTLTESHEENMVESPSKRTSTTPLLKPVKALSQMTPTWKQMRSVTHFLRYSILKCSKQTFTVRSAIVNSFTSSVFPSETIEETEKKLFLSCGRFHSLLVAFRNSKTRRHSEIKQTRPSTKQDFSEDRGLTSLTFILVPGADRVVRHICIRCISTLSSRPENQAKWERLVVKVFG